MVPELGYLLLVMSFVISAVVFGLACVYATGVRSVAPLLQMMSLPNVYALFFCIFGACILLAYSFLVDDFSVEYIANHSNTALPTLFKISAVWGGHEGSLLLWLLFIALWIVLVVRFSNAPKSVILPVTWILCGVFLAFAAFSIFTSSPFTRLLVNTPADGKDLNPLLQDIGLAIHPPLLYLGYVGFAVSFAFAIVALCQKDCSQQWARWVRPWANIAWAFLGFGIVLGSWWAYYELGWGGFWFWDPVENASFMPWLLGAALSHSLLAFEKRGVFRQWCVFLAIATFSLSILGAFLVRSGILDSVHAFASSPERGRFLLVILSAIVFASAVLYTSRSYVLQQQEAYNRAWSAKDIALLVNNFLLLVACATVILGTLYPIIIDVLGLGRISVGPPYFEAMFVPLGLLMAVAAVFGLMMRWQQRIALLATVRIAVWYVWLPAVLLAAIFVHTLTSHWHWGALVAMTLAFGLLISAFQHIRVNWFALQKKPAIVGASIGHIGFAFLIAGSALTHIYSVQQDVRIKPGDNFQLGAIRIQALRQNIVQLENYRSHQFLFSSEDSTDIFVAEKRFYPVRNEIMTEAAISAGFFGDIFIALGEQFQDQSWSASLQYKAFIRWVWLGGILISIGALLSISSHLARSRCTAAS